MLRCLPALLACLERAPGPTGSTAALPQISPMGPVSTPFPRTKRRPLEPGSPAQRFAATRLRRTSQHHRAHHSGKDQSRFPLEGSSLEKRSGSSANSPRVSRRSNSRLSRREASLLVLSKKGSSFAIPRISFCVSNHSSSSLSAGNVGVGPQTQSQQSRWRRPPKIQLPGRVAVDQPLAQEFIQDGRGL